MPTGMPRGSNSAARHLFVRAGALDPNFRWRTADGRLLAPAEMTTDHLINVISMVWNNFMAPTKRIGTPRLYNFPTDHYTKRKFMEAVLNCGAELQNRELEPWHARRLDAMAAFFVQYAQLESAS